jgi:hypothetical protein
MATMEGAGKGKLVLLAVAFALALAATGCATGSTPTASHGMSYVPTFYSPAESGEGGNN